MDMWNWLMKSYSDGTLTLEDLEQVLTDDDFAASLWEDYAYNSYEFVKHVREEVESIISYVKKNNIVGRDQDG